MTAPNGDGEHAKVALVLAGGGARGAYELGALDTLLPWLAGKLEADPQWTREVDVDTWRPDIMVGTSAGALNTAYLAATAERKLEQSLAYGCEIWEQISWNKAAASLLSWSSVKDVLAGLGDAIDVPGVHARRLIDSAPLAKTLRDGPLTEGGKSGIPFAQIHDNVHKLKCLEAAALVTTRASTSLSEVFYDSSGPRRPEDDKRRGIDYTHTKLDVDHVCASAAIPSVFPPVKIGSYWYSDGGTRLNTPIKPAIELGATHLVIVALNSLALGNVPQPPDTSEPELVDGSMQLIQGLLVDPLVNDLHTLADINGLIGAANACRADALGTEDELRVEGGPDRPTKRFRIIHYMVIAPCAPDAIGKVATTVYNAEYARMLDRDHYTSVGWLGGKLDVDDNPARGELFSYLFFAPEFGTALVEKGRADASTLIRRVDEQDFPLWQTGPPA